MSARLPITGRASELAKKDAKLGLQLRLMAADFGFFCRFFASRSPETGEIFTLDQPFDGQRGAIEAMQFEPRLYVVKARQIGLTTVETAWDAYVALTRPNAQVAIFSRGDAAATDALRRVEFGLRSLPEWAEVAIARSTEHVLEISAGPDDLRRIQAFPADVHAGRSRTNTHTTVDEWAAVENPQEFWVSIEPSCAGSVHILTTGGSPASYPAEFLRRCQAGSTGFSIFFADRYSRPGRGGAWETATRASMPADHFRREYPATIEDSFCGSGNSRFDSADIEVAVELSRGAQKPTQGHRYLVAWDVGRKHDASVGVVLDCTDPDLIEVVGWEYLVDTDFPSLQAVMQGLHERYGAITVVEVTGLGIGAFENADIPEDELIAWHTTRPSKQEALAKLQVLVENERLTIPAEFTQLVSELRACTYEDHVGDTVMATAIGVASIESAGILRRPKKGRLMKPIPFH